MFAAVFITGLIAAAVFTRLVRKVAGSRGWACRPASGRHIHTYPVPRLGGIAIFLSLWCTALLGYCLPGHLGTQEFALPQLVLKILGPATIVFVIGLIDDFRELNAYVKFFAQAGAAVLLYLNGAGISEFSFLAGHQHLGWLIGLPLTIVWVLWITNAFNLIDGLDGLAAGSALFSTLVMCVVALVGHNQTVFFLTLALAGAITGFLRYNFNPASIFLGDCGSLLIGFLISAIAIVGSHKSPAMVAVAIPIVALGLPILDVAFAVARRFLSCKRLFEADREHIHHKLLSRGISHRQAVLSLYGVSACFGLVSLLLLNPGGRAAAIVLVLVGAGVLIGVRYLGYDEFVELGHAANRTLNQRQVIANDISIRRAVDVLESCGNLEEFSQILRQCLEPIGFDGFGLYFSSGLPGGVELGPCRRVNKGKMQFLWSRSLRSSEANWSLTFSLASSNGGRLGRFILYRKDTASPLLMDLELFTATGFSRAIASSVERMYEQWAVRTLRDRRRAGAFDSSGRGLQPRVQDSLAAPSSS